MADIACLIATHTDARSIMQSATVDASPIANVFVIAEFSMFHHRHITNGDIVRR